MKNTEKVIVGIAVILLAYVGVSYAVTGSPFANPWDIGKTVTHPTYQVSFALERGFDVFDWDGVRVENLEVNKKSTLSISPKQLRVGPWCPAGFIEGTTRATVLKPSGEEVTLINDPNLALCRGDQKPYKETFTYTQEGTYRIQIRLLAPDGRTMLTHTKKVYLRGEQ